MSGSCIAKPLLVFPHNVPVALLAGTILLCLMLFALPAMHSLVRQCWLVVRAGLSGKVF